MKKVLVIIISFLILGCKPAQIIPKDNFKKEKIILVDKSSKSEIFIKANNWMVDQFKSAESVIEFSDKESGTLLGKYLISGRYAFSGGISVDTRIFAKIDIRIKDDRTKILITPINDINIYNSNDSEEINKSIDRLIKSYEEALFKSSDW